MDQLTTAVERFNRKTVPIEAMQYAGTIASFADILAWANGVGQFTYYVNLSESQLVVGTKQGPRTAAAGDWIVKEGDWFAVYKAKELTETFEKERA